LPQPIIDISGQHSADDMRAKLGAKTPQLPPKLLQVTLSLTIPPLVAQHHLDHLADYATAAKRFQLTDVVLNCVVQRFLVRVKPGFTFDGTLSEAKINVSDLGSKVSCLTKSCCLKASASPRLSKKRRTLLPST